MDYTRAIAYITRLARMIGKELIVYDNIDKLQCNNDKSKFKVFVTDSKDELIVATKSKLDVILFVGKGFSGLSRIADERTKGSIFIHVKRK